MKVKLTHVIRNLQNSPKSHMNQWRNDQSSRNERNHMTNLPPFLVVVQWWWRKRRFLSHRPLWDASRTWRSTASRSHSTGFLASLVRSTSKSVQAEGRACLAAPSFKKKKKKILGTTSTADHVQSVTKTENVFVCKNVYWGACFYACVRETAGIKMQIYAAAYRSIQ